MAYSERDAARLFLRSGCRILSRREKGTVITRINGKEHFGQAEADFIIRWQGRRYGVLVAEGASADPNEPLLRRRILEVERTFGLDGVIVLDPVKGSLQLTEIRFPREWNLDRFFRFLIGLFIIAGVIGIIWLLASLKLI